MSDEAETKQIIAFNKECDLLEKKIKNQLALVKKAIMEDQKLTRGEKK
jgi:hypothetical protein